MWMALNPVSFQYADGFDSLSFEASMHVLLSMEEVQLQGQKAQLDVTRLRLSHCARLRAASHSQTSDEDFHIELDGITLRIPR
jgi:hypothetical protein